MTLPLISALGKQGQVDLYEFEDSVVYIVSFRISRATQQDSDLKKNK